MVAVVDGDFTGVAAPWADGLTTTILFLPGSFITQCWGLDYPAARAVSSLPCIASHSEETGRDKDCGSRRGMRTDWSPYSM